MYLVKIAHTDYQKQEYIKYGLLWKTDVIINEIKIIDDAELLIVKNGKDSIDFMMIWKNDMIKD